MNKQTIISLLVIIIGLTSLVWWSKLSENRELNSAVDKSYPARAGAVENKLIAEKIFFDFGKISMKNGNVSTVFKVTNSGNEDIRVPSLHTSCMCTVAYLIHEDGTKKGPFGMPGHGGAITKVNEIIKTGESRDIEVVYDPNAHGPAGVGKIDRFVFLEDENGNKLQFEIKANVTP